MADSTTQLQGNRQSSFYKMAGAISDHTKPPWIFSELIRVCELQQGTTLVAMSSLIGTHSIQNPSIFSCTESYLTINTEWTSETLARLDDCEGSRVDNNLQVDQQKSSRQGGRPPNKWTRSRLRELTRLYLLTDLDLDGIINCLRTEEFRLWLALNWFDLASLQINGVVANSNAVNAACKRNLLYFCNLNPTQSGRKEIPRPYAGSCLSASSFNRLGEHESNTIDRGFNKGSIHMKMVFIGKVLAFQVGIFQTLFLSALNLSTMKMIFWTVYLVKGLAPSHDFPKHRTKIVMFRLRASTSRCQLANQLLRFWILLTHSLTGTFWIVD